MKHTTIAKALDYAGKNPIPANANWLDFPTNYIVCRRLFEIANNPDPTERGSMSKATRAQKIIMDRLVGKRRPGTHPAAQPSDAIEFVDLTKAVIENESTD